MSCRIAVAESRGIFVLRHSTSACFTQAATVFVMSTPYVFDISFYNIFSSLVVHCGTCCILQRRHAVLIWQAQLAVAAQLPDVVAMETRHFWPDPLASPRPSEYLHYFHNAALFYQVERERGR